MRAKLLVRVELLLTAEWLPADSLIKPEIDKLREKGLRLAESSKLAINRTAKGILPYYFYTYYELSAAYNIDSIVFIM